MAKLSNEELRDAVTLMRREAVRSGPMHALWDVIFDVEALLSGRKTTVDRDLLIEEVEEFLNKPVRSK